MADDAGTNEGPGPSASALFGATVNCDEAVHQLYHYLDGELTDERRGQIADHLNYCGPCGGAAEFEAELRQVIADRCKDHVPESLMERIAVAIDGESRQHGGQPSDS